MKRAKLTRAKYRCFRSKSRLIMGNFRVITHMLTVFGVFRLDAARDSQVCYKIPSAHRPFYSYNTRYAVKYHFFLGIVSVWWLLKPSTRPIPHKYTHSNLMCGLGSIVWFVYHHTETIPKRFRTLSKLKSTIYRAPMQ